MSFDLIVYFTAPAAGLKERWEGALADEGLPLRFPDEIDVLRIAGEDLEVTWTAPPRLITLPAGEARSDFPYVETGPRAARGSDEDLAEVPALPRARMQDATHQAFFSSSAGRSADGLALQLFGAATLAKAGNGVLYDPQEDSYMDAQEALAHAHRTLAAYRRADRAEEASAAERAAATELLDRRRRWFRGMLIVSSAVWAALAVFLLVIDRLKVDVAAAWVPVVTIVPLFGAAVLTARSTRYLLEELGVSWPLPWLLGVICVFPPFHAIVYWWAGRRYRRLRSPQRP